MTDWIVEQIKTIHILTEITLLLIGLDRIDLLPTVLELMQIEIQQVVDENCIKDG